jgi:RNA polymerase sigma factor (sigma-70 family)
MTGREPSSRADTDTDPIAIARSVYPRLLKLARATGCQDSAEDWAQEALIETVRRYPGFSGLVDPSGYTRTVLLRLVTRGRLRAKRRIDREISSASLALSDDSPSDVEAQLRAAELLARLPVRQRACVYLSVVRELSDREAAEVLGCRPSTVRSNVTRALAHLKRDSAFLSTTEWREHA